MRHDNTLERHREKIEELVLPSEVDDVMRSSREIANDLGLHIEKMLVRVEEYLEMGYASDEAVVQAGLALFEETTNLPA